jgi:hypothetical protein
MIGFILDFVIKLNFSYLLWIFFVIVVINVINVIYVYIPYDYNHFEFSHVR